MTIKTLEDLRQYCATKAGSKEDFPFDNNTLVFKVMNKIFALTNITWSELKVNLKCEPEFAELLREKYQAIVPGYHMNKKHWNTVTIDGSIPNSELLQLIDHSYDLVVSKLKKSDREKLEYKDYLNKLN
ncbi:MAG TPA: MmcQ/YjbR family DNA-binding protein [Trueperaceae bacterium]|nr:MmcQ/YjbR family DNA-binding protein [Trueperaceae bacterium]